MSHVTENVLDFSMDELCKHLETISVNHFKTSKDELWLLAEAVRRLKHLERQMLLRDEQQETQGHIEKAVMCERRHQTAKHGSVEDRPHDVGAWLTIIRCELREAEEAWMKGHSDSEALCEILQVVAVGFACMEQHGVVQRNFFKEVEHGQQS